MKRLFSVGAALCRDLGVLSRHKAAPTRATAIAVGRLLAGAVFDISPTKVAAYGAS
jgi:hypothetical protein